MTPVQKENDNDNRTDPPEAPARKVQKPKLSIEILDKGGNRRQVLLGTDKLKLEAQAEVAIEQHEKARPHMKPFTQRFTDSRANR